MSNGSTLSTCGCCQGLSSLSPETNSPGQPALSYRLATYADFLQRMLSQIASPNTLSNPPAGPWAISALSTRSDDDPAIALLDAWSVVLDVLTFYQERIANEGFLRTATEHRSVLELARAIGYELNPGVAASTYLSFIIEDVIGSPSVAPLPQGPKTPSAPTQGASTYNAGIVTLPIGTQVQSVPPQGQLSQTFETSAELDARTDWNLMLPRITRPADFAIASDGNLYLLGVRGSFPATAPTVSLSAANVYLLNPDTPVLAAGATVQALQVAQLYISGTNSGIAVGDLLLLLGINPTAQTYFLVLQVRNVVVDNAQSQTCVEFSDAPVQIPYAPGSFPTQAVPSSPIPFSRNTVETYILDTSIEESDLQALIKVSDWDPELLASVANYIPTPSVSNQGIFAFSAESAFFGNNAPLWKSLTKPTTALRGDAFPQSWDQANNGAGTFIWTDSQGVYYKDATVFLEKTVSQILSNSWVLVESKGAQPTPFQITAVADKALADYGLNAKSTGLTLKSTAGQSIFSPGVPVIANAFGSIYAFAIGSDGNFYNLSGTSGSWGSFTQISTVGNFSQPPAVIVGGPTPVEVFFVGSDGRLYHAGTSEWSWWGPVPLGASAISLTGTPSVITGAPNLIDVFATGTDGNVYHYWYESGQWNGPEEHSEANVTFINSPCAVGHGPSTTEVFMIGSNGYLYHMGWTLSTGWWGPLLVNNAGKPPAINTPVNLINSPSVVVNGLNNLDVFATGEDGNLYHAWYLNSTWNGMENLGGNIVSGSPCALGSDHRNLDVFYIGTDGYLYNRFWTSGYWFGPVNIGGGNLVGSPSAIVNSAGYADVMAMGSDGNYYHFSYNGYWWQTPEKISVGFTAPMLTRKSKVHLQSEQQLLAEIPVTDDIEAGTVFLMLNGLVVGLTPGQAVAVSGTRSDASDVAVSEVVLLVDIQHIGGYTQLEFSPPGLQYSYSRSSMTLNANTIVATNGATIAVPEVLGSGNAAQINQSFQLKRSPVTYVPAATASGAQSTIQVQVNDIIWQQQPSLFGLGSTDRSYIARQNDDGTTAITFGDGVTGGLLPTGQNNVTATYRVGLGTAGNVPAGSLSVLQSRPPGLRSVSNPVAASGGADPEALSGARGNAPLTVLTLDRIVSVEDYGNFAAAFAGIGKAQAISLTLGQTAFIHITVAGVDGTVVDPLSQLLISLSAAIDAARDPLPQVYIASYQPVLFNITAIIIIDETDYVAADVHAEVVDAITAYFDFEKRSFAQPVTAAEVIATIQAVTGVVAVDLNQLYRNDDSSGPSQTMPDTYLPARYAKVSDGTMLPAELLLLNPIGFSLTDKKQ
jgi:hypothetical protein